MKAVVSRVSHAAVRVDGEVVGQIDAGLLAYIGVMKGDDAAAADWLADKLVALRIFADDEGKMNRGVADVGGRVLLIPNFTLAGRTKKGTRPSFTDAAPPQAARELFDTLVARCARHVPTATGRFGSHMRIDSEADGPITITIDSAE